METEPILLVSVLVAALVAVIGYTSLHSKVMPELPIYKSAGMYIAAFVAGAGALTLSLYTEEEFVRVNMISIQ